MSTCCGTTAAYAVLQLVSRLRSRDLERHLRSRDLERHDLTAHFFALYIQVLYVHTTVPPAFFCSTNQCTRRRDRRLSAACMHVLLLFYGNQLLNITFQVPGSVQCDVASGYTVLLLCCLLGVCCCWLLLLFFILQICIVSYIRAGRYTNVQVLRYYCCCCTNKCQ